MKHIYLITEKTKGTSLVVNIAFSSKKKALSYFKCETSDFNPSFVFYSEKDTLIAFAFNKEIDIELIKKTLR